MSFLIADAFADTTAQHAPGSPDWTLIPMVGVMFALMYFLMIRPQRKRQKEMDSLLSGLGKGDEVVLTSGMLGKIVKLDGDYIVVNTGNNIELKFQKQAVHAVLPKGTIKAIDTDK